MKENREKIYVWKCGSGGFLKYFSIKNILKWYFYLKKIIFDINTLKWSKNINIYIYIYINLKQITNKKNI
jgi:hypothetical protein